MQRGLLKIIPWLITVFALYYAFSGISWQLISSHMRNANLWWVFFAAILTFSSYLLRARRWQHLFPAPILSYADSARVLILGFFMNNILPARTGEFVRAHMGARLSGETRTLVLATVASERLADGLTLSLMFIIFAFGLGDATLSKELLYVAIFFAFAALSLVVLLSSRSRVFTLADKVNQRVNNRASNYTFDRFQVFINGLSPLCNPARIPFLIVWSLIIWFVELLVYYCVSSAFGGSLPFTSCVLFLVAVNFSSLIPAAPGGIGVIEAVASRVLVSIGVQKELALTMVILQHVIQYLIVGIPGSIIMFRSKQYLRLKDSDGRSQEELVIS